MGAAKGKGLGFMFENSAHFMAAMMQLPTFEGIAWRAASFELNAPFDSVEPIPLSRDLRVATENLRAVGVHMFITSNSRDISALSAHPTDQEVVLLPGARLIPASSMRVVEGIRVQSIIELPASDHPLMPIPSDHEIEAAVKAARARSEVPVYQKGRFGA
ncbi:hypothetical protein [Microbacterium hydrocarbonoxydans]|uniref:hypothetical protein n=1 Tax=Microbacterium hydrocarbonoxydans TaxID=273678 RepID=UPI0005EC2873|nr:hypothetical protein [Microbacterium hydrocarbonoxydans]